MKTVSCRPAARLPLHGPRDQLASLCDQGMLSTWIPLHLKGSNAVITGNANYCSVVEFLSTIPALALCRNHIQRCHSGDAGSGCAVQSPARGVQDCCGHAGMVMCIHCASQALPALLGTSQGFATNQ